MDGGLGGRGVLSGFGKIGVRFDEAVEFVAFDRPIVDGGGASI